MNFCVDNLNENFVMEICLFCDCVTERDFRSLHSANKVVTFPTFSSRSVLEVSVSWIFPRFRCGLFHPKLYYCNFACGATSVSLADSSYFSIHSCIASP